MSKLSKIALGAVGFGLLLGILHAWLNLGFDPATALGLRKVATEEETRFRVGFLRLGD